MKQLTSWEQLVVEVALLAKLKQWEADAAKPAGLDQLVNLIAKINGGRLMVAKVVGGRNVR